MPGDTERGFGNSSTVSTPRQRISTLLLLVFSCSSLTQGAVIWYEATGTFTGSDFPGDIAIADRFSAVFAYNDSVTDTTGDTLAGRFPGALLHFAFRLLPGSVGKYAGGNTTVFNPVDTFDGVGEGPAAIPDRFYVSAAGGNFGSLNGHPFGSVLLVLDDYSHTSSIHDTGFGQTLDS